MTVEIIGANAVTRINRRTVIDQSGRTTYEELWKGPIPAAEAKFDDTVVPGTWDEKNLDYINGAGVLRLSRQISASSGTIGTVANVGPDTPDSEVEEGVTRWELGGSELLKPLRSHTEFQADNIQAELEAVRQAFEQGNPYTATPGSEAESYYKLLLLGVTDYRRSAPVLRKTSVVTIRSTLVADWGGVDEAHKINTVQGPTPPAILIGSIETMRAADSDAKQWLKNAPDVRQMSERDWEIAQTWLFAEFWSTLLYYGDLAP